MSARGRSISGTSGAGPAAFGRALILLLTLGCSLPAHALDQGSGAASPPPKRVRLAVMDFDYGTISNPWWGDRNIGKGVADQIVDALVNDGTFIVVERSKLDTILAEQDFAHSDRATPGAAALSKIGKVLGVKYILAGSITAFGTEEKNINAGAAGFLMGPMGALNLKKAKTVVALTARLIDTTSGEIAAAAEGSGLSKKGGGITTRALLPTVGGAGGSSTAPDYLGSAIGEAQELACRQLVSGLLERMAARP